MRGFLDVVIDTSDVLAVLLREPSRSAVLSVTAGVTLVAPPTLEWEVGNALAAMFKRKRLALAVAVQVVNDFVALPIEPLPFSLELAVRLASQLDVYAYDAYMLACAQEHSLPLVTLDGGLRDSARRAGIALLEVAP